MECTAFLIVDKNGPADPLDPKPDCSKFTNQRLGRRGSWSIDAGQQRESLDTTRASLRHGKTTKAIAGYNLNTKKVRFSSSAEKRKPTSQIQWQLQHTSPPPQRGARANSVSWNFEIVKAWQLEFEAPSTQITKQMCR